MSAAIAGSEVAITVESMFSMNRAAATISGTRRCLPIGVRGREQGRRAGLYHPSHQAVDLRTGQNHLTSCVTLGAPPALGVRMIYSCRLLPPLGLLLNGQPFSAIFNLFLIVFPVFAFSPRSCPRDALPRHMNEPPHREGGGDPTARPRRRIPLSAAPTNPGGSRRFPQSPVHSRQTL